MAEQEGHNVVDHLESTSGPVSLVDAAVNHNNTTNADNGNTTTDFIPSDLLVGADGQQSSRHPRSQVAPEDEAEPSAGNATSESVDIAASSIYAQEQTSNAAAGRQTPDDAAALDISADASVASDNEGGRADGVKDGILHTRTNSVKKPATFSKVSVTKNFLAKSATTAPAVSKIGEKSAPTTMAAPAALKPRLVAKSASSLNNVSRVRNGADSSPGPDASTVWNKNRPAPAMPAKQFTDEELKQQYGIHLATRLQTDENGKGSKWADIDDDEDDWAPEAVVWMDGTKSTVAPAETTAAQLPATATVVPAEKPVDAPKQLLSTIKKLGDSSSTVKTILKPGAAAQAKQNGQNSAISLQEKQSLKAKSPAPVPAKSPWAALPPVDKISPVNPPVQIQQHHVPTFSSQDARLSDMPPPTAYPAREMATDTFDRSWREGEGERRELFNSTSGKYEPAPEGRRNSIKHEPYGRKPSVLQRTSQYGEVGRLNGPDGGHFGHRRGSSVSHGSGPSARRMSYSRGSDSVMSDNQGTAVGNHDMRPPPFSHQTPWNEQLPPPPTASEDVEDAVKAQERIMREKREAARQRRQEEEQREEAAKQERLRAKLTALAGAGLSRKERQAATEAQPANSTSPDVAKLSLDEPIEPESVPASAADTLAELIEEKAEKSVSGLAPTIESPASDSAAIIDVSPRLHAKEHPSPSVTSRSTFQTQPSGSYRTAQTSAFSSPGQPFARAQAVNHETFASWPSAVSSSGGVWSTKGIGNGLFDSSSSLFSPMPHSQQQSSLPPPPGMGRPATSTRISPQAIGQASQSPIVQDAQLADSPLTVANHDRPFASNAFSQGMNRQQHGPGPIGPPSRAPHSMTTSARNNDATATWQPAAQRAPQQIDVDAKNAENMRLADGVLPEHKRNDTFRETFRQTTGLQGRLGGPRTFDKAEFTIHDMQGSRAMNPVPPNAQTQPLGPETTASSSLWKQPTENAVRLPDGSQNPAHGGRRQQQPPIAPPHAMPLPPHLARKTHYTPAPLAQLPAFNDSTPPPPETSNHPVFGGAVQHPHVRLPPPPPIVRLPPVAAQMSAAHGAMQPRHYQQPLGMAAQGPLVNNREWQARFNGLFNRAAIHTEVPPSPPKTPPKAFAPVLAVASSSRILMDDSSLGSATVSLPQIRNKRASSGGVMFSLDNSSAVTSKESVQQIFNDELNFGSRPYVRLPRNYRGQPETDTDMIEREHTVPVNPQTKPDLPIFHLFYKKPDGLFVKLPGSSTNRFCKQHFKARPYPNKITKPRAASGVKKSAEGPVSKVAAPSSPANRKSSTSKSGVRAVPSNGDRKRSGFNKKPLTVNTATPAPISSI